MGGREVSRESFRHALRGGRSCLVVPGGQAEMLESQSDDDEVSHVDSLKYVFCIVRDKCCTFICFFQVKFSQ